MRTQISVGGIGCSLIDYLYQDVSFDTPEYRRYASRSPGDGGLITGGLVFAEDLSRWSNARLPAIIAELTNGATPSSRNLGGPAVVALVHAAQLSAIPVHFYGHRGDDETGSLVADILARTPLHWEHYTAIPGETPSTIALSDPRWNGGMGERTFINTLGVAGHVTPAEIHPAFFEHTVTLFGGTALLPALHRELHQPLEQARAHGAITVVNTVFDFHNESRDPRGPWPIGDSSRSYGAIDLLIMDSAEARRLSGCADTVAAARFFRKQQVGGVIITGGTDPVVVSAGGDRFCEMEAQKFPVSQLVQEELRQGSRHRGDTTGCGDTFVGGVLTGLVEQLSAGETRLDLSDPVAWGIASGGMTCFYLGGTVIEEEPGEKRQEVQRYYEAYRKQR